MVDNIVYNRKYIERYIFNAVSYRPSTGLLREQWVTTNAKPYSISNFNSKIPGYPHCPHRIENVEKFEYYYSARAGRENKYFRFTAYLVSPTTGLHKIFVICQQECQLEIELQPNSVTEKIHILSTSSAKK